MKDLDHVIENYFKPSQKTSTLKLSKLFEMIEEVLETTPPHQVQEQVRAKTQEFLLSLPKFTPSEAWGNPESMERQQITRIFSNIRGGASVAGKLKYIQRIASPENKITSPRRIISTLIVLESLAAVVNSFNAASAGFVFEGFLAALLYGTQEAEVSAKGNLPIQDLIAFTETETAKPLPISLKLLNLTTNIEGSYTNLIDALDEFGEMVYIVARKDGEKIAFEQFVFNRENFIDALVTNARGSFKDSGLRLFRLPKMGGAQSVKAIKNQSSWEEQYDLLQQTDGYSKKVRAKRLAAREADKTLELDPQSTKPEDVAPAPSDDAQPVPDERERRMVAQDELREAIKEEWSLITESSGGLTQWAISPAQLKSFGFVNYEELGTLPYTSAELENIAELHIDKLNGELLELFQATAALSENINKYFTFDKRDRAINSGERAIKNTEEIADSLKAQISSPDEE
tara:strand:+ start:362 stop:1738 length:1377 start_codon:yes stop_codon:yes gene_type:complete